MDKTLFLGNGLNRTLSSGLSWAELMKRLGSTCTKNEYVPFPIEFEEIAANRGCKIGKRSSDPYKELRSQISEEIGYIDASGCDCHSAFCDLGMRNVITTNYDEIIESLFSTVRVVKNPGSSRNILGPISAAKTIDFYHAHGVASWKNTLCLGHEHYASLIGKIRNEFYSDVDDGAVENLSALVSGERAANRIWPELLFTSDVAIVGLGLDYCEIDLWWLLSLRASLFQPSNHLDQFANEILYFSVMPFNSKESAYETGKLRALDALGVQVQVIEASDYREGYFLIADTLRREW